METNMIVIRDSKTGDLTLDKHNSPFNKVINNLDMYDGEMVTIPLYAKRIVGVIRESVQSASNMYAYKIEDTLALGRNTISMNMPYAIREVAIEDDISIFLAYINENVSRVPENQMYSYIENGVNTLLMQMAGKMYDAILYSDEVLQFNYTFGGEVDYPTSKEYNRIRGEVHAKLKSLPTNIIADNYSFMWYSFTIQHIPMITSEILQIYNSNKKTFRP